MKISSISPGDICSFTAIKLSNPKTKYHVCVAPASFFYINTNPLWQGSFPISRDTYQFLDHDSYIGCGQLIEYEPDMQIPDSSFVTKLHEDTLHKMFTHINEDVNTLTTAQYRKIARSLKKILKTGPSAPPH